MTSDVVLTAALRNNLLSLQNTQRLIDTTQLRLATGLKVASALDDPQNFFAAEALNNRAGDLTRLLDGIGQSIRTIETADKGVTALTKLVEQAQSVVNSARDELAASAGDARVVGSVDLSTTANLVGFGGIAANDVVRIRTTDDSGTQITEDITIINGDTAYTLAAKITDQFADNRNSEITANITEDGFLEISSVDGRSFRITSSAAANDIGTAGWTALGLGTYFADEARNGATVAGTTVVGGNTIRSISLYEAAGNLAEAGDLLTGSYIDSDGNTVFSGFAANDTIAFNIDIGSSTAASGNFTVTANTTFQDLVDHINQTAAVNDYIEAEFDSSTGQIRITSLQDSVENVEITYTAAGITNFQLGFGDPTGNLDPLASAAASTYDTVFSFNSSTETLDRLATDYNTLRDQIDRIVIDANYRGVNLLRDEDLTTFFNEDNTSSLVTQGVNFTADGLGITAASFRSSTDIELSATQTRTALEDVRAFGSTLANNLSIIQIRQDFTQQTVNTLTAGADDLTVADQNEEGANLLALQTRQALGVTSLSLASQSQQAVLRLF